MDDLYRGRIWGVFVFHSTEAVWERIAREEWLGCRHVASPMFGIPRSTPVWAQLQYFFGFYDINTYMYYVFKIYIYCIKEHWWSLTSSWPDEVQRMFSTAHEFSKEKSKPQTVLWTFYINFVITVPFALFNLWDVLLNSSSTHV